MSRPARLAAAANAAARSVLTALAHGAILVVWSEAVFWAGPIEGMARLGSLLPSWIVYSVAGVPLVALMARPGSARWPAIVLAGAVYGWIVEGAIAATLYLELPISISWTGLAWHMPVTVWFGWYGLPILAARPRGVGWLALAGLVWGLWAAFWPNERAWFAPEAFALYAFAAIAVATLAQAAVVRLERGGRSRAAGSPGPPRWLIVLACALLALGWAWKLPALGPFALVLPALLVVALPAARRLEREVRTRPGTEAAASALTRRRLGMGAGAVARVAVLPLVAALVHGAFAVAAFAPPFNIALYLVTVPLGFGLLALALARALLGRPLRRRHAERPPRGETAVRGAAPSERRVE